MREALRQLESERVVEIQSHRGAKLRTVDAEFVGNMYDLRGALEVLLVGRCVERAGKAELAPLPALAAIYDSLIASGEREQLLQANRELHSLIYRAARNPDAERIIGQGWELIHAYRMRFGFGAERLQTIAREHRGLVEAIMARDHARAVAAAQTHRDSACEDMLRCLATAQPQGGNDEDQRR